MYKALSQTFKFSSGIGQKWNSREVEATHGRYAVRRGITRLIVARREAPAARAARGAGDATIAGRHNLCTQGRNAQKI